MDWTDLAQDRDKWQAAVNTVTNLYVPQYGGASKLLASQERLCSTDFVVRNTEVGCCDSLITHENWKM
jgi:hypothetical protein